MRILIHRFAAIFVARGLVVLGGVLGLMVHSVSAMAASAPAQTVTVLRCGHLWDGRGGPSGPVYIEIKGEKIVSMRAATSSPPPGVVTDLKDRILAIY